MQTLHNVEGDENCLFRLFTGSEHQHIEVHNAIVNYMSSIENHLVGYGKDGNYNYLHPFGHTSVRNYIDSYGMEPKWQGRGSLTLINSKPKEQ